MRNTVFASTARSLGHPHHTCRQRWAEHVVVTECARGGPDAAGLFEVFRPRPTRK